MGPEYNDLTSEPLSERIEIEQRCVTYAVSCGFLTLKLDRGNKGWPDRALWGHGEHMLVEFKLPRGRLSAAQKHVHGQLARAGFTVHVVRSLEIFKSLVDSAVERGNR